ncbi:MAG: N-6 DNA methylase, partial [candidate division Zixibacteria bacterium]|nr:N-6 DNA methylase [candidate division Zixibacteria bacterium]
MHTAFQQHVNDWSPESVLRAKNIAFPRRNPQFDFYDFGLIPALEDQIERKLDPILKSALAAAQDTYRSTTTSRLDQRNLFRLAFRLLAGKVLHDRGVGKFPNLTKEAGPDIVLQRVAEHYGEAFSRILNLPARQAAFDELWSRLDFRNLSIDVLTFIWSTTLVTKEIRDSLGIHTTPRPVAKYIVDRLPQESFVDLKEKGGLVVEPCCGSAVFLVEAMQRIRDQLPNSLSPRQRHDHFRRALVGFEQETFGIEIARLCLTLADFPERNRWQLHEENVFTSTTLPTSLRNARVVLCNPPFQDFATNDPLRAHVRSPHKPAEILRRIMLDLHPQGVFGLVLPRKFLDSVWYRDARRALVARFDSLEIVSLPDVVFRQSESEHETALLIASQPRTGKNTSNVRHVRVSKADWLHFAHFHKPTSDDSHFTTQDEATNALSVPQLNELWLYLAETQTLGDVATASRGIEWNVPLIDEDRKETGNRQRLVLDEPIPGETREGVPPGAKISLFQKPDTKHLVMRPEDQRGKAYELPWDLPKVILNKARRSRGPWRISAFADFDRLTCYQTFIAVWPHDPAMTTALAATLNGPIANAFFFTKKEGFDVTIAIIKELPVPLLSEWQR